MEQSVLAEVAGWMNTERGWINVRRNGAGAYELRVGVGALDPREAEAAFSVLHQYRSHVGYSERHNGWYCTTWGENAKRAVETFLPYYTGDKIGRAQYALDGDLETLWMIDNPDDDALDPNPTKAKKSRKGKSKANPKRDEDFVSLERLLLIIMGDGPRTAAQLAEESGKPEHHVRARLHGLMLKQQVVRVSIPGRRGGLYAIKKDVAKAREILKAMAVSDVTDNQEDS